MGTLRVLAFSLTCSALVAAPPLSPAAEMTSSGAAPHVTISNTGMEGLSAVQVQVHVAGGADWRELVDLDEAKLRGQVEDLVKDTPGLALIEGHGSARTPRLEVIAVGHLIADPQGNKDTSATNLSISLKQPVSVRRSLPSGKPILTSGMTWHRNILITGLNDSMRERVADKLAYLVGQFKAEHLRANPPRADEE